MGLTFVVGTASDAFQGDLAVTVAEELRSRYSFVPEAVEEPYESEPVHAAGWLELQNLMTTMVDGRSQLAQVEAYQAVFIPGPVKGVDHVALPAVADPLQVVSLEAIIDELTRFAAKAQLPTDDLELMQLAADYLEEAADHELDFQTYVQLMLSARQAVARKQALWIVT
ncbi:MAG TPA: hypothetical protein VM779_15400 [Thermoanaerobaculia bacterium]|nr:hypothetical protein [Thermoanaerobaculia bacterium]